MINNRQGGRRRGRGGSGGGRQPGAPGPGNRQENRNRGNAAQLLEKYKSMARDAQMAGDRVQTEYFLQFADHYYRVLNENRARFEEQRPQREENRDDFGYDEDEAEDEGNAEGGDERDERSDRQERSERPRREDRQRDDRPQREDRPQRADREDRGERAERERPRRDDRDDRDFRNGEARPRRGRRERFEAADEGEERIALEALPPAISAGISAAPEAAEPVEDVPVKAPRRRTRRVRDEGDEIAPAA